MITENAIHNDALVQKYSWNADNTIWKYLEDEELGGGAFRDYMAGAMTPGMDIWSEMVERL